MQRNRLKYLGLIVARGASCWSPGPRRWFNGTPLSCEQWLGGARRGCRPCATVNIFVSHDHWCYPGCDPWPNDPRLRAPWPVPQGALVSSSDIGRICENPTLEMSTRKYELGCRSSR